MYKRIMTCVVTAALITSCGMAVTPAETDSAEPEKQTVTLYSSMQEDILASLAEAFEERYPDMELEYYFASTQKITTQIAIGAQTGQVKADVVWVGDPVNYMVFKQQKLLKSYISVEDPAINTMYMDAEGFYTAARVMNMGIAYNTGLVSPEEAPKSWEDLLDQRWRDKIVMTDPGNSGTSRYWRNAMMSGDRYGVEYIKGLKANGCRLENSSAIAHGKLAAGSYEVGVCLDYIAANLANEGLPIAFIYPEDTVSIYSSIGLMKGCRNEKGGKLLYDFILSKEGQMVLIEGNLLSVRIDMGQASVRAGEIAKKAMAVDINQMVLKSEENAELFDRIFGL